MMLSHMLPSRPSALVGIATVACVFATRLGIAHLRRYALRHALAERAARKVAERDASVARAAASGLDWAGVHRWAEGREVHLSPCEVVSLTASQLLEEMGAGRLTSEYVMRCFVGRAMAAGHTLCCNAEERFEAAVAEAVACDEERERGTVRGPLHGLPISVKDQHDMAGFDSTCGLACRVFQPASQDALIVSLARRAGAIPFVRTTAPQLMMAPENFSFWGTGGNCWDVARAPGGSSGGEGALIGARGSPLGIGADIGGSVRIPASFCGITGFKPTCDRLSGRGMGVPRLERLMGQKEVRGTAGPMARCVADLELLMKVWCGCSTLWPQQDQPPPSCAREDATLPPVPWDAAATERASTPGHVRFGVLLDDGWFEPAPACKRAVVEAAEALRRAGHSVVDVDEGVLAPGELREVALSYVALLSADGKFRSFTRALEGEALHPNYSFLYNTAQLPGWARPALARLLRLLGQPRKAALVEVAGEKSAHVYWLETVARDKLKARVLSALATAGVDVLLCPALGVPAVPHGMSRLLAQACSYTFVYNNLNLPAGTLATTRVQAHEEAYAPTRDRQDAFCEAAREACQGSAGLPVSVQVVGMPWRDEMVLGAMRAVERSVGATLPPAPHPPLESA
mmetsp:Transcript_22507/g.60890  ORF Transcript_22507/g.60890 Transcript_22507/m.60890 type:complete len:631 (-) Transcript_22507:1025-2917(-)